MPKMWFPDVNPDVAQVQRGCADRPGGLRPQICAIAMQCFGQPAARAEASAVAGARRVARVASTLGQDGKALMLCLRGLAAEGARKSFTTWPKRMCVVCVALHKGLSGHCQM